MLEAEQLGERERHDALAVAVHILAVHGHLSVQWRSTPSIMLATSENEGDFSCEWMHSEFRSTCQ